MVLIACCYLVLGWLTVWRFQKGCLLAADSESHSGEAGQAVRNCYRSLWPQVTQLKPIHKADASLTSHLRSFVCQDYPGRQRVILASSGFVEGIDLAEITGDAKGTVTWSQGALEGTNRKISAAAVAAEGVSDVSIVLSLNLVPA